MTDNIQIGPGGTRPDTSILPGDKAGAYTADRPGLTPATMAEDVAVVAVGDVTVGTRVFYPCQESTGRTTDQARTVTRIIEYPVNRVLYFTEGGYGVADRDVRLRLAPPVEPSTDEVLGLVRAAFDAQRQAGYATARHVYAPSTTRGDTREHTQANEAAEAAVVAAWAGLYTLAGRADQ